MNFTEEMLAEDEKRWHARDVVTELGYCGNYMRDHKDMKNIDIRFYAYIMRKAYAMLKEQEARMQCIKGKCRICPHCDNCDVDENGLLKEQEAVKIKVKKINDSGRCGRCPNCLIELNETDYPKFCGFCGKAVKWK